jgi:hypothetical protein
MWGDAAIVAVSAMGADTFAFSPDNSYDTIIDFANGADHIELATIWFLQLCQRRKPTDLQLSWRFDRFRCEQEAFLLSASTNSSRETFFSP